MAHLKSHIQSCVYYLSLGSETLKFTRSISDTFMKLSNKSLKTIQEEDCKLDHNVHVQKNVLSILHLFQCFFRGIRYLHQIFLSSFTWSCTYIHILFLCISNCTINTLDGQRIDDVVEELLAAARLATGFIPGLSRGVRRERATVRVLLLPFSDMT